ncbi:MAG: hemolysin family protein [Lapillicoccus sp.]
MNIALAIGLSVLFLLANAFFVAAEFAVVSAKRHRLEVAAAFGGRSARAAVRNSREPSLGLAGAQLGITLATLGLGAMAKPAVADLLDPLLQLSPIPEAMATTIATVLAVAMVVFLHMVVGEMAPKSWAISHPERSAILLGLPFRAFMASTRWVLQVLNGAANALLRIWDVEPVDETTVVQGPAELQMLIDTSREHGLIEAAEEKLLSSVLDLSGTPVYAVTLPLNDVVGVELEARASDVERRSRESGRSRLVVLDAAGAPSGLVHVRDAVLAVPDTSVAELAYVTTVLDPHASVVEAIGRMRADRSQLALVAAADGDVIGITALEDLLERVLGEFDDETDRPGARDRSAPTGFPDAALL